MLAYMAPVCQKTSWRAVIVGQSLVFCHAADSYVFLASSWPSLQPSCYRFFILLLY